MKQYIETFEATLAQALPTIVNVPQIREASVYALSSGGKRLRPCITLMVAEALGHGLDVSPSALCIEYLHTASLIADDLPCMDNARVRRGRPALHKVYGEAVALLTSYALIAAAYRELARNGALLMADRGRGGYETQQAVAIVSQANACATEGQQMDLSRATRDEAALRKVLSYKTGSLFLVPFALGWLFGGGDPDSLSAVTELGSTVGWIYQLVDDIADAEQDCLQGERHNAVLLLGHARVQELLEKAFSKAEAQLESLGLATDAFSRLLLQLRPRATGAPPQDICPEQALQAH